MLRGAVGGALGAFLWAMIIVFTSLELRSEWWQWLIIGFVYPGLPAGFIIGLVVATMIWLINSYGRRDLRVISRFVIGTFLGVIITWLIIWTRTGQNDYVPTPWHLDFLWIVLFGAMIGGVAGMLVGNQHDRALRRKRNSRIREN